MLKILSFIIFFLLVASNINATYENAEFLLLELNMNGTLDIKQVAPTYTLGNITINISAFPMNTFQQNILLVSTLPPSDGALIIKDPVPSTYPYQVNIELRQEYSVKSVNQKISYRRYALPDEIKMYLAPGNAADANSKIEQVASGISKTDDYYEVVVNTAVYMTNFRIENLSLGDGTKEKATEVLDRGTGDEIGISALFISLLRSMNIPARFVYGLYEKGGIFIPHYWVEVYIPQVGFVPFDITAHEFGIINPTHIKLKEMQEINPFFVSYKTDVKEGVNIIASDLGYDVKVKQVSSKLMILADAEMIPLSNHVKPNSYNIIEVVFHNKYPFYLPIYFGFANSSLIPSNQFILLSPGTTQSKIYTIPPQKEGVSTLSSQKQEFQPYTDMHTEILISKEGEYYSKEDVEKLLNQDIHFISSIISKQKIQAVLSSRFTDDEIVEFVHQAEYTKDSIEIRKSSYLDKVEQSTKINLTIIPSRVLYNFSVYENIPKCLAEKIDEIVFREGNYTILNADPLIAWHFIEVTDRIDLSYELKDLKDIKNCENESLTLALAEEIGKEIILKESISWWKIILPLFFIPLIIGILVFFSKYKEG